MSFLSDCIIPKAHFFFRNLILTILFENTMGMEYFKLVDYHFKGFSPVDGQIHDHDLFIP